MPIHIIFDGPSSHESGRFVEVEDDNGKSICIGEWNHTPGKLWELVIPDYKAERDALAERVKALEKAIVLVIGDIGVPTSAYPAPIANAYKVLLDVWNNRSPSAPEGVSDDSEPVIITSQGSATEHSRLQKTAADSTTKEASHE